MKEKSLGFIGGGRVARIILGGLKKAGRMPGQIVASDTNPDVLKKLQSGFPAVQTVLTITAKLPRKTWFFSDCIRRQFPDHSPI